MLLSDEEIRATWSKLDVLNPDEPVGLAFAKAQLKKVVEELNKYDLDDGESGYKLIPYYVWDSLLEEIK